MVSRRRTTPCIETRCKCARERKRVKSRASPPTARVQARFRDQGDEQGDIIPIRKGRHLWESSLFDAPYKQCVRCGRKSSRHFCLPRHRHLVHLLVNRFSLETPVEFLIHQLAIVLMRESRSLCYFRLLMKIEEKMYRTCRTHY